MGIGVSRDASRDRRRRERNERVAARRAAANTPTSSSASSAPTRGRAGPAVGRGLRVAARAAGPVGLAAMLAESASVAQGERIPNRSGRNSPGVRGETSGTRRMGPPRRGGPRGTRAEPTKPPRPTPRPSKRPTKPSKPTKLKTMTETQRLNYKQLIKSRGKAAADKFMRDKGYKV